MCTSYIYIHMIWKGSCRQMRFGIIGSSTLRQDREWLSASAPPVLHSPQTILWASFWRPLNHSFCIVDLGLVSMANQWKVWSMRGLRVSVEICCCRVGILVRPRQRLIPSMMFSSMALLPPFSPMESPDRSFLMSEQKQSSTDWFVFRWFGFQKVDRKWLWIGETDITQNFCVPNGRALPFCFEGLEPVRFSDGSTTPVRHWGGSACFRVLMHKSEKCNKFQVAQIKKV